MGGGMGGSPTAETKSPTVGAGTMSPNTSAPAGTGSLSGLPSWTSGMQLPDWASSVTKEQFDAAIAGMQSSAATAAPAAPTANLGFPTAAATQYAEPAPAAAGFTHEPYPTSTDLPHIGAPDRVIPTAPTTPAGAPADTGERVAVYLPGGGFGFGTASGMFGSTGSNTYQQRMSNGQIQEISNPYGITIGGVDSMNDPWQVREARELGWVDPKSWQQDTTMQWHLGQAGIQPTSTGYTPGQVVPAGTNNVPTMSKALYDWNMKVFGNPYGAGYTQQYIGGPTQTPVVAGDHQ
jgi:hypothetical protein